MKDSCGPYFIPDVNEFVSLRAVIECDNIALKLYNERIAFRGRHRCSSAVATVPLWLCSAYTVFITRFHYCTAFMSSSDVALGSSADSVEGFN